MYSASTKHGPVHPRDVDDVDERSAHDLDERCTSTPHAQHEGAQHGNAQQGHAQHRENAVMARGREADWRELEFARKGPAMGFLFLLN